MYLYSKNEIGANNRYTMMLVGLKNNLISARMVSHVLSTVLYDN